MQWLARFLSHQETTIQEIEGFAHVCILLSRKDLAVLIDRILAPVQLPPRDLIMGRLIIEAGRKLLNFFRCENPEPFSIGGICIQFYLVEADA